MVLHRILFHTGRPPVLAVRGDARGGGSSLLSPPMDRFMRQIPLIRCSNLMSMFSLFSPSKPIFSFPAPQHRLVDKVLSTSPRAETTSPRALRPGQVSLLGHLVPRIPKRCPAVVARPPHRGLGFFFHPCTLSSASSRPGPLHDGPERSSCAAVSPGVGLVLDLARSKRGSAAASHRCAKPSEPEPDAFDSLDHHHARKVSA